MPPHFVNISLLAVVPFILGSCMDAGSARFGERALTFADVTAGSGLEGFGHVNGAFGEKWFPETMGAGAGFIDYDDDGRPDILLVAGGAWPGHGDPVPALRLFRNEADGTFSDQTEPSGLAGVQAYGMGVAAADYDNDGDEDIFFTTLGHDVLLRNDEGVFVDVTHASGVGGPAAWSTAAMFFDPDRDGDLDLLVGGYTEWSSDTDVFCSLDGENKTYCTPHVYEGIPPRYYENDGEGRFEERTEAAGFLTAPQKTLGVAQLDYNRDGWPDVVVANDMQADRLYRNHGDGTFTEEGLSAGIALGPHGRAFNGMGVDVGVVDETGEETIFIGNFSNQPIGVFRHDSRGFFKDRAAASGISPASMPTLTFGLLLFDADLDGDLDLYAANGHVQPDIERTGEGVAFRQPSHLFLNTGDGMFADAAPHMSASLGHPLVARGAAAADADGDGDLDLLVTENGGPVHLYRNDLEPKGYVRVVLEGRRSNRNGIGARVVAVTGDLRQVRFVSTGSSYLSQSEMTLTFGLGERTSLDSLIVEWPSGARDVLIDVPGNQQIVVIEGLSSQDAQSSMREVPRL